MLSTNKEIVLPTPCRLPLFPYEGVFKRGEAPLLFISPSPSKERGIKGVR